MTQISIGHCYKPNSQILESDYPSSFFKESKEISPSPQNIPSKDTILNFKLRDPEENIAFNQNFIYRRERDNDPSTFSIPNELPSKREHKSQPTSGIYKKHESDNFQRKEPKNVGIVENISEISPATRKKREHKTHLMVPTFDKPEKEDEQSPLSNAYSQNNSNHNNSSGEINELLVPVLKRFIMKLRNTSIYRSTAGLKTEHYELLDDNSHFEKNNEDEGGIRKWLKRINSLKFFHSLWLIRPFHPYNPIKTSWDLLHFLMIIALYFFIPLETAFLNREFQYLKNSIYIMSIIFFSLDIGININTGYFSDGILVKERHKICWHYLGSKGMFWSDISALFALFLSNYILKLDERYVNLLGFIIFGKMSRLKWLYSKLTAQFKLQTHFKSHLDLLHLIMTSLLVLHILACFWLMIGLMDIEFYHDSSKNWLKLMNLQQETWYIQYVYSFYWAVVTMMTVGYGDISPKNSLETMYATLTIICGCGVYGYYLNTVGILLQDIHKEENKYNSNLRVINLFMERKAIDNELQMRVREYLRFIWNEEKAQNDEDEAKIINSLNTHLKEELLLKAYGNILKQFPMFYANFSEKSLRKMVIFMKEIRFIPGDLIFFEQELDDSAIYFINKGSVEVFLSRYDKTNPHSLRKLKQGECFGELGFFSGQPREASARSLEFISVFMIKRADFVEIIKENEDDYQKFCMIRDQIMLYNDCRGLRLRCSACGSLEHLVKHCSLLHYVADVEKIIKRYEFYNDQPRIPNPRAVKKRPNGLFIFKRSQKCASKIQKELKREKENEKNEFLRKKFMQGDYDTQYFNSEVSLSSEEDEDSLEEDDDEESVESQNDAETNTFHTDTIRNPSRNATSFENLMKQSYESSNILDKQVNI